MRGPGPGGFQPNPERFVERAMQFDRDGDGKLSRDELMELAKDMPFGPHRPQGPSGPPETGPGRGPGRGCGPGWPGPERPRRPDF